MSQMKHHTLRISLPIGQSLGLALVMLAIICGAAEALARDASTQKYLPRPSISGHPQIAFKLQLLDRLQARQGPVDCFMIGSSLVRTGIEPSTVDDIYHQASGKPLNCFNFGLDDLDSPGAAALAHVLVTLYHPALIIYGTSYRDYSDDRGFNLDIPWGEYWLGKPSAQGWLEANSLAFRYVQTYRSIAAGNPPDQTHLTVYGFFDGRAAVDVSKPPVKNPDGNQGKIDLVMSPTKLQSLQSLAQVAAQGVKIIVVEMPQPASTISQLGRGEQDYEIFLQDVADSAAEYQIPFVETRSEVTIPANGWGDYKHMNGTGARVFSRWLGKFLAR